MYYLLLNIQDLKRGPLKKLLKIYQVFTASVGSKRPSLVYLGQTFQEAKHSATSYQVLQGNSHPGRQCQHVHTTSQVSRLLENIGRLCGVWLTRAL